MGGRRRESNRKGERCASGVPGLGIPFSVPNWLLAASSLWSSLAVLGSGGCVYLARKKGRDLSSPFLLLSGVLHLVSASSFAFFHRLDAFSSEARLD